MNNFFKNALVATVALTGVSVFAQAPEDTGTTTLNVNVGSAYEITVAHASVDIAMNTPTHFQSGSDSGVQANHVQVSATGEYEVTVIAASELLNGTESIDVNTVTVTPELGTYLGAGTAPATAPVVTLTPQALNTATERIIISTDTGESLRGFDVKYSIPAANAPQYLNKPAGTYSTTVTYSLYAR